MRVLLIGACLLVVSPAWAQRPNGASTVEQVARQHPQALIGSCGGWEFMDRVVDILHASDARWGYNGKRGNANDPSHDAIAYQHGAGDTAVYIFDIIGGHCGANPQPAWIDQTEETARQGTIGRYVRCRPGRTNCGAYAGGGSGGGGGGGGGTGGGGGGTDYGAQLARIEQQIGALSDLLMGRYATLLEQAASESLNAATRALEIQDQIRNLPTQAMGCVVGAVSLPGFLGGTRTIKLCPEE